MELKNTRSALQLISEAKYEKITNGEKATIAKIFTEKSKTLKVIRKTIEIIDRFDDLLEEEDVRRIDDSILEFTQIAETYHLRDNLFQLYSRHTPNLMEPLSLSSAKIRLGKNLKLATKPFLIAERMITAQVIDRVSRTSDEMLNEASSTIEALEELKLRAMDSESIISGSKSLFANFLNRQEMEIQSFISAKNNEIGKFNSQLKEDLIEASYAQDRKIQASIESMKNEIVEQSRTLREIAINEMEPTKSKAIQILDDVKNLKEKTQELIGEISSGASAKHYEDAYKGEMYTRIFWQALSFIGFIAIAVIIQRTAVQLLGISNSDLTSHDIFSFSIRATSIFMAVFFITYCSKQASKHHELEKFNRQMRFELLTIDTYLSTLSSQDQRESAKLQLKENFFGQSQKLMADPSKSETPQTVTGEIKGVLDSLVKVLETSKSNRQS
jgi:hypothetical protein